jgi:hypothetical protein
MQANYMLSKDPLSLDRIRSILTRLEDTIIFSLIERAQFAHNPKIYEHGVFKELKALEFEGSWLEWFLKETEAFHGAQRLFLWPQNHHLTDPFPFLTAKARRYTRPVPVHIACETFPPSDVPYKTAQTSILSPQGSQIPSSLHLCIHPSSTQTRST